MWLAFIKIFVRSRKVLKWNEENLCVAAKEVWAAVRDGNVRVFFHLINIMMIMS